MFSLHSATSASARPHLLEAMVVSTIVQGSYQMNSHKTNCIMIQYTVLIDPSVHTPAYARSCIYVCVSMCVYMCVQEYSSPRKIVVLSEREARKRAYTTPKQAKSSITMESKSRPQSQIRLNSHPHAHVPTSSPYVFQDDSF